MIINTPRKHLPLRPTRRSPSRRCNTTAHIFLQWTINLFGRRLLCVVQTRNSKILQRIVLREPVKPPTETSRDFVGASVWSWPSATETMACVTWGKDLRLYCMCWPGPMLWVCVMKKCAGIKERKRAKPTTTSKFTHTDVPPTFRRHDRCSARHMSYAGVNIKRGKQDLCPAWTFGLGLHLDLVYVDGREPGC